MADNIVGTMRQPNHPMYSRLSIDVTQEQNFCQKETFSEERRFFSPFAFRSTVIVIVRSLGFSVCRRAE